MGAMKGTNCFLSSVILTLHWMAGQRRICTPTDARRPRSCLIPVGVTPRPKSFGPIVYTHPGLQIRAAGLVALIAYSQLMVMLTIASLLIVATSVCLLLMHVRSLNNHSFSLRVLTTTFDIAFGFFDFLEINDFNDHRFSENREGI